MKEDLFVRKPDSKFNLANFIELIYSLCSLNIGLDILYKENVETNSVLGHGGIFKTKGVAQVAAAMKTPVSVMKQLVKVERGNCTSC